MMNAVAWEIERQVLLHIHGQDSMFAKALSGYVKEWLSVVIYAVAIGTAFINTYVACALYALVAAIWIVPDRRIERQITSR